MTTFTLGKALNEGLRKALEDDPKVLIMGQGVGQLGGVFRITGGLQKDFGEERVIDTPLAESGIIGTAVGLAIRGYRPVCEIQFDGFVYPAYDQIVSQVAKMHYRSRGKLRLPIVIRIPFGGGIGAVEHHSESPEAYFAHTAGLKVVACSNPEDAYWMIQQAIATDDPVVFFEPKRRYWEKGEMDTSGLPADAYPLFASRVLRSGTDATVIAYGPMVRTAMEAAPAASAEGRELEEFPLPDLGEGLTEGEILKWLVAEGDMITLNQPIVEVETAKAAVEIPAKWAGKVTRIFHPEGATVEVGMPIIAIDTDPGAGDLPPAADLPAPSAASLAAVEIAPAEGSVEPGMIGGPAPGGRTAVLVGYGPRTATAKRRPRVNGTLATAPAEPTTTTTTTTTTPEPMPVRVQPEPGP